MLSIVRSTRGCADEASPFPPPPGSLLRNLQKPLLQLPESSVIRSQVVSEVRRHRMRPQCVFAEKKIKERREKHTRVDSGQI